MRVCRGGSSHGRLVPWFGLLSLACADILRSDFGDYRVARDGGGVPVGSDGGGSSESGGAGGAGHGGVGVGGRMGGGGVTSGGVPSAGGRAATGGGFGTGGSASGGASSGGTIGGGGAVTVLDAGPPVAFFLMVDRSGSMVTGVPEGSAQSWSNATVGIQGFLADQQTQTLDVGLGFFPTAPDNGYKCSDGSGSGSDCGVPRVEIGPVPTTAAAINTAMANGTPNALNLTPTECALNGMITHCKDWKAAHGEPCAAVLVTDGSPTICDTTVANLVAIVAAGLQSGISTFVLGLPGSSVAFLDQLAQAGGTTASIDVSGGAGAVSAALVAARSRLH